MQSARGDLIALFKTLINAGAFPVIMSWADLYHLMTDRHAPHETVNEARKLWREYQKSTEVKINPAVPPGTTERDCHHDPTISKIRVDKHK